METQAYKAKRTHFYAIPYVGYDNDVWYVDGIETGFYLLKDAENELKLKAYYYMNRLTVLKVATVKGCKSLTNGVPLSWRVYRPVGHCYGLYRLIIPGWRTHYFLCGGNICRYLYCDSHSCGRTLQ